VPRPPEAGSIRRGEFGMHPTFGPMTDPSVRPALWMLSAALAFALMGTLAHALGSRCDWMVVALVRAGLMLATTALLARGAGVRLAVWEPPTLWMRGLAATFSLVCNFFALARLPVADALTLTNAHPLWIVALTSLLGRRRPPASEVLGLACGLAGIVLIQRPHLGGGRLAVTVALI